MRSRKACCAAALASCVFVMAAACAEDIWTEDFEAAKVQAEKEQKDLLVDFTGSDWCGWCKKLDAEVFSTPQFCEQAPKFFVLVKIDFPKKKTLSDEVVQRNRDLQMKYGIRGFPTILLMDAQGEVFAQTGYKPGGVENYLKHLQALRSGKAELAAIRQEVETTDGVVKAKALDRLVQYQQEHNLPVNSENLEIICKLDADGNAGLKAKYEGILFLQTLEKRLGEAVQAGKADEVEKIFAEGEASDLLTAQQKQELMIGKAGFFLQQGEFDKAIQTLAKAQKIAPDTELAKRIPDFIKQTEAARDREKVAPK